MKKIILLMAAFMVVASTAFAQSEAEKEKVLGVVQNLFNAMAEADTATAADLFMEGGHAYVVRAGQGEQVNVSLSQHQQFLESMAGWEPGSVVERMWDTKVLVQDNIAVAWTPYDLHVNGNFSHCGVNIISLIKTDSGWKIADITYSAKQQGCTGPPDEAS